MSTVDVVQRSVMTSMLRGELGPGTWIRQDELAARFGTSKIPVREALHRLAAVGLLRFETNRGVMVPQLTAADAEENFALRRAVEPLLLRRAIGNLSIVDLAEAELALSDAGSEPMRSDSTTAANWRFHRALYRASGWDHGLSIAETLHAAVAPYVVLYTEGLGGASDSDGEHRRILRHCRNGEADRAVTMLEHHLDAAAGALTGFLGSE